MRPADDAARREIHGLRAGTGRVVQLGAHVHAAVVDFFAVGSLESLARDHPAANQRATDPGCVDGFFFQTDLDQVFRQLRDREVGGNLAPAIQPLYRNKSHL